jgi:hypothetical protein
MANNRKALPSGQFGKHGVSEGAPGSPENTRQCLRRLVDCGDEWLPKHLRPPLSAKCNAGETPSWQTTERLFQVANSESMGFLEGLRAHLKIRDNAFAGRLVVVMNGYLNT